MIELEIKGNAQKSLDASCQKFKKGCMNGLKKAGQIVKAEIKRLIKDPPKTGKKYQNLPNRSSAAGESPAYQTGVLSRSANYVVPRWNEMEVGVTAFYGKYLELGTEKMAPRPFVSVAVSSKYETVKIAISMAVDKELGA